MAVVNGSTVTLWGQCALVNSRIERFLQVLNEAHALDESAATESSASRLGFPETCERASGRRGLLSGRRRADLGLQRAPVNRAVEKRHPRTPVLHSASCSISSRGSRELHRLLGQPPEMISPFTWHGTNDRDHRYCFRRGMETGGLVRTRVDCDNWCTRALCPACSGRRRRLWGDHTRGRTGSDRRKTATRGTRGIDPVPSPPEGLHGLRHEDHGRLNKRPQEWADARLPSQMPCRHDS